MKSEILKTENLVEKILGKLITSCGLNQEPVRSFTNPLGTVKKIKRLPTEGFIAGGSICNTILSILDGKEYPINDIDVFLYSDTKEFTGELVDRNGKTLTVPNVYSELMTIDSKNESYSIISSTRDEVFNYVYIRSTCDEDPQKILNGFDINCCMVGIDMLTKKLYYTKDFEDFLNHRQLLISNPYTPCHSSLRLLKKRDELGCYIDLDKEMRYLSNVFNMFDNPYNGNMNRVFGNFFSDKYKGLYENYSEIISEYFELKTFLEIKKEYFLKYNSIDGEEIPEYLISRWSEKTNLFTFKTKKYKLVDQFVEYIPNTCRGPNSLRKVWNIFEKSNKSEINKALMILKNVNTAHFFFSVEGFHKCDFNEKNLEEFVKIFNKSESLVSAIVKSQLNLQESISFYKTLKSISSKESTLFVDIILDRIVESYGSIDKKKIMNKDFLKMVFEEEKNKRSNFLIQPLDVENFEYKLNVYELVTEYDLMFASRTLHNCMSNPGQNYASKIKSGKVKLFLIETENNYSGVELEHSTIGYKLITVLGTSNTTPCEKHVYISKYLVNYLNHRHWLLKSNEIMDKLTKNMENLRESILRSTDTEPMSKNNRVNRMFNNLNFNTNDFITDLDFYVPTEIEIPTLINTPPNNDIVIGNPNEPYRF